MKQDSEKIKSPFKMGTQNDRILRYLLSGKSLLNWEMREKFGVLSHTRRISDLRRNGFIVESERISQGVWRYWLVMEK